MSVTMHLWKVNPNVKYRGWYMDYATDKDLIMDETGEYPLKRIEKELGAPDSADYTTIFRAWEKEMQQKAWSDGIIHDTLDLTYMKSLFKVNHWRGCNRILKKLRQFPIHQFSNGHYTRNFIVVDEMAYAQGWFFKNNFFKRKMTWNICTTKHEMEEFFKKYIDYLGKDTRGEESVQKFLDSWENGMIFECAF